MNYNILSTTDVELPEKRIRTLLLLNPKIELNINMAVIEYYHFGRQLINKAKVNAKENNLEKAYVYYTRFMTLFLETIKEHPDYKNVPIEERNLNYRALRKAFLKTENIKTKLLEQFRTQYKLHQEQNKFKIKSCVKINNYFGLKSIIDRSTKPMLNKNTTSPYNLRQIIVPVNLAKEFKEKVQHNTFNNLKTCGILAEKLIAEHYVLDDNLLVSVVDFR